MSPSRSPTLRATPISTPCVTSVGPRKVLTHLRFRLHVCSDLRCARTVAFTEPVNETNIASLSDTVTNLTDAESSIRDADFAAETARLTRAQILVQSGTQVLAIANQNPQNVLALLRG